MEKSLIFGDKIYGDTGKLGQIQEIGRKFKNQISNFGMLWDIALALEDFFS